MTYQIALGDRAYSSWSLRGWLLFAKFGIPVQSKVATLYTDEFPALLAEFQPARSVPAMRTPEGKVVCDTIAIAEELNSRHPEAGIWPTDPDQRAIARSLSAEMHSGFSSLRGECPMNLRIAYSDSTPSEGVLSDLQRLEKIWDWAFQNRGEGPWLLGAYSAADAFFAPVAARIAGYSLPVSVAAQAYVASHLADPAFRRWRAMALVKGRDQSVYDKPYSQTSWPGPAPRLAKAIEAGVSENALCPYSGDPVTHLLEMDGRNFGFCNAFCRDKTVADPEAWSEFMRLFGDRR